MGVERVSDVDDPRLADYRDLKDGARRRRDGTFIAESRQVVRRLLGGSRFRARSVLAAEASAEDLRDVLTGGLPVYVAPQATLQRVVGFNLHPRRLAGRERGAGPRLDRPPGTSQPVPERVALLLGSEEEGLSAAARAAADLAVAIRMADRGQSLNVATASGIALHRLAR